MFEAANTQLGDTVARFPVAAAPGPRRESEPRTRGPGPVHLALAGQRARLVGNELPNPITFLPRQIGEKSDRAFGFSVGVRSGGVEGQITPSDLKHRDPAADVAIVKSPTCVIRVTLAGGSMWHVTGHLWARCIPGGCPSFELTTLCASAAAFDRSRWCLPSRHASLRAAACAVFSCRSTRLCQGPVAWTCWWPRRANEPIQRRCSRAPEDRPWRLPA